MGEDFIIEQDWASYRDDEHETWRILFARQQDILRDRAAPEFLEGLKGLGIAADGIPDFERLSDILDAETGWRIVAVPGLAPDDVFFGHLANRRFPATNFIRRRDQLDYLKEPDVFHDVYGHVPLLLNPVFADYLQAYGRGGLKALGLGSLTYLARLYWYTVEFGLIRTPSGLRIYGSGIVSSKGESIYSLESAKPRRVAFDLMRIMRTDYRIDDYQDIYFVIESYDQLFAATAPDFTPYYEALKPAPTIPPRRVLPGDRVVERTAIAGAVRAGPAAATTAPRTSPLGPTARH